MLPVLHHALSILVSIVELQVHLGVARDAYWVTGCHVHLLKPSVTRALLCQ